MYHLEHGESTEKNARCDFSPSLPLPPPPQFTESRNSKREEGAGIIDEPDEVWGVGEGGVTQIRRQ